MGMHPEVYSAWIQAGGDANIQIVAKVPELGKWAVGFGGKKNAERAAKLALAISIAMESDRTPTVVKNYPSFGRLLAHVQATSGAGAGAGNGAGMGAGVGAGMGGGMGG